MKTRILFVPATMPSHFIPLVALAKQLNPDKFECSILLPALFHPYISSMGIGVLPIDRSMANRTIPEMMAIAQFNPHLVVDDLSYTTAYSSRLARIPRIAVVRTGILPFENQTRTYAHTCPYLEGITGRLEEMEIDGTVWKPGHYSELFIGHHNILPAIPSAEPLPEGIVDKDAYSYAGPLILSDRDTYEGIQHLNQQDNRAAVGHFLDLHRNKPIVYFTMGLTMSPAADRRLSFCLEALLERDLAIITNIPRSKHLQPLYSDRLYSAPLLPMNDICARASLMIHHCGSGTYNYQLNYQVPAIIIGTQRYDRDEVAIRLQQQEAAVYIPEETEEPIFRQQFINAIDQLLVNGSQTRQQQVRALDKLKKEITTVQSLFNFENLVTSLA